MNEYKIYNLDKFDRKETGLEESDDQKNRRAIKLADEMCDEEEQYRRPDPDEDEQTRQEAEVKSPVGSKDSTFLDSENTVWSKEDEE